MNSKIDRRAFLKMSACAAAAVEAGCVSDGTQAAAAPLPKLGDIRALLLHLGHNMWCDWFPPDVDPQKCKAPKPDYELRNKDDLWLTATDYAVQKGVNMIVIDVGEGVVYPSHPELSIRGSWSVGKLQAEVQYSCKFISTDSCKKVLRTECLLKNPDKFF